MSECEAEAESQSAYSPGIVDDAEPIVYVLVEPLQTENGTVRPIKHDRLKKSELSVVRAAYTTGENAKLLTVDEMIASDPSRSEVGYLWALASEIRAIKIVTLSRQAFCIVDEAYEHFPSHAHIGYSSADDRKNGRAEARGNLLILLTRRGSFSDWSGEPFNTVSWSSDAA